MKTFILLSGLPGVGKSTWAKEYAKEHPFTLIVSSDELRKVMTGSYQNFSLDKEMWELFYNLILYGRNVYDDVTIIADATNIYNTFRLKYGEIEGFDKKIFVEFKKPLKCVFKQNESRDEDQIVPKEIIEKMNSDYNEVSDEVLKLFDEHLIIT